MREIEIELATGYSRRSVKWKNKRWTWRQLVERCRETKRTDESVADYVRMSREEQSDVKDVGGFVGGYLSGGRRQTANVMTRSLLTLDLDYATLEVWDDFTMLYDCAALLYSTHKHTSEKPRCRLVIPLSRPVAPYEYEPIARRVASDLGIDMFDVTTYELARLFYWPSTSRDGEWWFENQEGPALDPDTLLKTYRDFRDVAEWPIGSREQEAVAHEMRKAGDPCEKPGLIGAFCRAYHPIETAVEELLSDVYAPAGESRYTYRGGSTAGGMVCYGGNYAYSFHETDPAGRQLCNAFDLVRLHRFGVEDEGSKAGDVTKLPSYQKMTSMAASDSRVRQLLAQEKMDEARSDFDFGEDDTLADDTASTGAKGCALAADTASTRTKGCALAADTASTRADAMAWTKELEVNKRGEIKPTAKNIETIMENDPRLKGRVWRDLFSNYDMVEGRLPWKREGDVWTGDDDACMRVYMEKVYSITGRDKIRDVRTLVAMRRQRHPIREYLESLEWDGTERLDRLVVDYIGAEDTPLTRAMTRKHFTAAVARVMSPGCKYDTCLVLAGAEGIGKSTLFSVMGGKWFSDSVTTAEGKQGMEQLRTAWIVELAELASIRRSDVETIKNFLSKQVDTYRAAYASTVKPYPRQCVFCGTTNETRFLKGDTGNRRFWVVAVDEAMRRWSEPRQRLMADRNQLWAEAMVRWRSGEPLYLSRELEQEARKVQQLYNEGVEDPTEQLLDEYLDLRLPYGWNQMGLEARRNFYLGRGATGEFSGIDGEPTTIRTRFNALEFLTEYVGMRAGDERIGARVRHVNLLMRGKADWRELFMRSGDGTRQRGFERKPDTYSEPNEFEDM
jgi:predicted P-loop ATPase